MNYNNDGVVGYGEMLDRKQKQCITDTASDFNVGSSCTINTNSISDGTYTVQQAVNMFGFGWFHVKLSLLVGLCWMADSMEMTILSLLGPPLICEWGISKFQQSLITIFVFIGMMLSSMFWNQLSNRYGRKLALSLCGVLLALYSILSSVAPTFTWLLVLRGLVGFAIGCVPQSVTLYAEFLPVNHKGKCVVLMDCFWALGASFEVVLALIIFPYMGWRWLLGVSSLPLLAFAILSPWMPESPRFYMINDKPDKAVNVLEKIARDNNRQMVLGRLITDGDTVISENFQAVLGLNFRKTTILLWIIWMSCAFCYYGLVLSTTELLLNETNLSLQDCQILKITDLMNLLWITLAEFPGIFGTIFFIRRFGKKKTMIFQYILFVFCVIALSLNIKQFYKTILLFIARAVISGLFQAAYISTPELYPANLRSLGIGGCSFFARIGAMFTPYVAQVLIHRSIGSAFAIYAGAGVAALLSILLLP